MGRSVYTPSNSRSVFFDTSEMEKDEWDEFVEDITDAFKRRFPSMEETFRVQWIGREARVLARNRLATLTVSEYMGCTAFSLIAEGPEHLYTYPELSDRWVQVADLSFLEPWDAIRIYPVGSMSNGVTFYRRKR